MDIMKYEDKFKDLSVSEAGELIISLFNYNRDNKADYNFSSALCASTFKEIRQDIDKCKHISQIRSKAGKKGMNSRYGNL